MQSWQLLQDRVIFWNSKKKKKKTVKMFLLLLLTDFVKSLANDALCTNRKLLLPGWTGSRKYDWSALLTFARSFFWNLLPFKNIFRAPFTRWIDKINPGNIPFAVSRLIFFVYTFVCTSGRSKFLFCTYLSFKSTQSYLSWPNLTVAQLQKV